MSYVKIMIHSVWGTKNRNPIITNDTREVLLQHIVENCKTKGIYITEINAHVDHVHCLLSLGANQSIDKVMQLIKGESSNWANKEKIFTHKFQWAEDYFAASVSESSISKVREYIRNQDKHHSKITFQDEYNKFILGHGLKFTK